LFFSTQLRSSNLAQLVVSWWQVDRIRTSPSAGRLLRLQPPCVVVVEDRPAEVLARTVSRAASDSGRLTVTYDCRSALGACTLRLEVTPAGTIAAICWTADGTERRIEEDAVEVYQPAAACSRGE